MSFLDQVTPIIITFNEEPNIARTLEALDWAQTIIVVDSFSTDNTLQILEKNSRVKLLQREFDHFAGQWNFALPHVETPWVLTLDADYVLSEELSQELKSFPESPSHSAYQAHFRYCVFGEPLRSTILPARTVLFRKEGATFVSDGHAQHLQHPQEPGTLQGRIYHDDRKSFARWLDSQAKYAALEVEKLKGTPSQELNSADRMRKLIFVAPLVVFFYCLLLKGGLRDGWRGLYYAFQRTLAELTLSLHLIEYQLKKAR